MPLSEAIAKRRSVRSYTDEALTLQEISQLAWAGQGITEPERGLRAAPSAGATYPIELYLFTPEGVFRYVPQGHRLLQLSDQDGRSDLSKAALGQQCVAAAPLSFVVTAVVARTSEKYGERAERYVQLEAGHVAENIALQAVALGLGSVPVGAFRDAAITDLLALPAGETPLYVLPVGHPS
jgi:SagB-type dehydrogenase family enzyme